MLEITQSSLGSFRECPRKYFYKYVLQRERSAEGRALSFGRLMHGALERWWTTGPESAVSWLQDQGQELDAFECARLCAMLKYYNPPRSGITIESVEKTLVVPIKTPRGNPMTSARFSARLDGLARDSAGRLWVLEHKTTSEEIRGFGAYWQRLAIDQQVAYYCIATGAVGALYDVLRKPALRPRNGETPESFGDRCEKNIAEDPERFYAFREIHKTATDMAEAALDLYQQVKLLRETELHNLWARNSSACRSLYGVCPFLDVCTGRASIEDDMLFRTKTAAHEELQEQEAAA